MASITKRTKKDGSIVYRAEIVIKKKGVILHRESKSFDRQRLAKDWGLRREVELQETDVYQKTDYLSIGDVIQGYIDEFEPTGRSKIFDLRKLQARDIAKIDVHNLNAKDLIRHIRERNKECSPQTANNDLIWLGTVIKTMSGVLHIETDLSVFDSAREVLRREGLISKSKERDRLPTKAEIIAISKLLHGTPTYECWWFALYSARRISEICRIEWDDINHVNKTCILRDLKDPRKKGVTKRFKIPKSAYKIIMRQPKIEARIFPYNPRTIGDYFTDACKLLGIKDLHFHDSRHAATTELFRRGLSIQQVQQVTLHSTWSTLQRYVNLDPGELDI